MNDLEKRIQDQLDQPTSPDNPVLNINHVKGLWIPIEIFNDPDLTSMEKFLMAFIYNLDQSKEGGTPCWASNKWFAEKLGVSQGRLKNILSDLNRKGKITFLGTKGIYRYIQSSI